MKPRDGGNRPGLWPPLLRSDDVSDSKCKVDDCDKLARARGWCSMHYERVRQYGDANVVRSTKGIPKGRRHKDLPAYIRENVEQSGECWEWARARSDNGYGILATTIEGERFTYAHRVAYRVFVGAIPAGEHIDHICHNKSCVNPDHLRLATNAENHENLKGARSDSRSGIRGAIWSTQKNGWFAVVYAKGKRYYGGKFATAEEAGAKAAEMRRELHTHHFPGDVA